MPTNFPLRQAQRLAAVAALVIVAAVAVYLVLLKPGAAYTVHVLFRDAGQLVPGDEVEVAGRAVGTIDAIKLTDDGLADVVVKVTAGEYQPLHLGTQAQIRTPGLAGVANRYVALAPASRDAPRIPDGGTIPLRDTHGIVDLDILLDALDPPTRTRLQHILRDGATAFSPPAGKALNRAFGELDPAFVQVAALGRDVTSDQRALSQVIGATAAVSGTLAARRDRLAGAVDDTAAALREIADHRRALGDALERAPAVLAQADGVLARTRVTLRRLDPFLRALAPASPRLAHVLAQVLPITRNAIPALTEVRELLPGAVRALAALPPIAKTGVPAIASATRAIKGALPIVRGLRPYAPDLIGGFFNGFGGDSSGYYDANGHYTRISLQVGAPGASGIGSLLPAKFPLPNFDGTRTGLLHRCPGAAAEPADDHSNPFMPSDVPGLCNPAESHR